jgi:O-antigen/teichoic acid export membrane protein
MRSQGGAPIDGERLGVRVARNTAFLLAGEVAVKLLAVAFSVLVVRRLGAADFGRYSAALAFVVLFSIVTDLGTSYFSLREMAGRRAAATTLLADLIGLRLLLSLGALVLIPAAATIFGESEEMVRGVFLASFTLLIYAVAGPVLSYLIARERLDVVSSMNVLNQALFITFGTVALLLHRGFVGLLVATLLAQALAAALAVARAVRELGLRPEWPDPRRWRGILRASSPFFVSQVSDTSLRRFDVVFLLFALGERSVGWYSVSFNLVMMLLPLAQSLGLSVFPGLVRRHASGSGPIAPLVQRALRYVLLVSLPVTVGGALLADRIIRVLYTDAFAPSAPVLRVLVWTLPALFASEILGRTANTLHLERRQARISIASTILGVVLIVAGVELIGLAGAALAAVAVRVFVAVATTYVVGPRLVLEGNVAALLRIAASTLVMAAGLAWLLSSPEILPASPAVALAALIAAGAALYAAAALALQAIDFSERRFLAGVAAQVFRRVAFRP